MVGHVRRAYRAAPRGARPLPVSKLRFASCIARRHVLARKVTEFGVDYRGERRSNSARNAGWLSGVGSGLIASVILPPATTSVIRSIDTRRANAKRGEAELFGDAEVWIAY